MERWSAPVISSASSNGAGGFLDAILDDELEEEELELEDADSTSSPESAPPNGGSASSGTAGCSEKLKYFHSTSGTALQNN